VICLEELMNGCLGFDFFIMNLCAQTMDLNIEMLNFFMSTLKLEVFYGGFRMSRHRPIVFMNVST
jgi:hypothetical protein